MTPAVTGNMNNNSATASIAAWEIISIVVSILIAEWVVFAFAGNSKLIGAIPVALALLLMFISHRERGETLKDIGFRTDNFIPSLRLLLAPTIVAILVILIVVWWSRGQHFTFAPFRLRFLGIFFWALLQQYALQGFINRRAQIAVGTGLKSIFLVGLIFGLVHLPNPMLATITFVGGLIWAAIYQRMPNLFALAISHMLVSVALALSLSQDLVYNLRVGFKYFG